MDNGYTYKYDDGILYQCGKDEERDTWIYSMQALTKEDYEGYVNARENKGNNNIIFVCLIKEENNG